MQHAGGYTPFVVDATGLLKTDKENELLVRLDNRNNSLIPPGKPLETLDFLLLWGNLSECTLDSESSMYILLIPFLTDIRQEQVYLLPIRRCRRSYR